MWKRFSVLKKKKLIKMPETCSKSITKDAWSTREICSG